MSRSIALIAFVTALMSTAAHLMGQSSIGGSVTGTVLDASGATVPNASVALKNNATGVASTGNTTSAGQFVFPVVPAGQYTLTVSAPGFSQSVISGITVSPNQTTTESIQLQVGTAVATVEVRASAVHLETETAQRRPALIKKRMLICRSHSREHHAVQPRCQT